MALRLYYINPFKSLDNTEKALAIDYVNTVIFVIIINYRPLFYDIGIVIGLLTLRARFKMVTVFFTSSLH